MLITFRIDYYSTHTFYERFRLTVSVLIHLNHMQAILGYIDLNVFHSFYSCHTHQYDIYHSLSINRKFSYIDRFDYVFIQFWKTFITIPFYRSDQGLSMHWLTLMLKSKSILFMLRIILIDKFTNCLNDSFIILLTL